MYGYVRPPLAPFQVTLLPEQVEAITLDGGSSTSEAARSHAELLRVQQAADWDTTIEMLRSVLALTADYTRPQVKFAHYSPEKVMRCVRGVVDEERCHELLLSFRSAVRDYTAAAVKDAEELQRRYTVAVGKSTPCGPPVPISEDPGAKTSPEANEEDAPKKASAVIVEQEEEEGEESDAEVQPTDADLYAVQTLALVVTHFERLHHGVAEIASVWAYANQWCALQASREIPRSLGAASTQEASSVFREAPSLLRVALAGYLIVLKAELKADTALLAVPITAALSASAASDVTLLHAPATAADAALDASALALLACPASIDALTGPLRRRLLFVFSRLTKGTQQYNAFVEPAVVRLVQQHFRHVARRWWEAGLEARRYFQLSENALQHADTVYEQFLHHGTIPLVEDAIRATLIGGIGTEVLKRDFAQLMEREHYHAMRRAWRLLSASAHVRSSPAVVKLFREYLRECGQGIMEELVVNSTRATLAGLHAPPHERPYLAVRHLIGLLEQGRRTVDKCFYECEKEFKVALHEALQSILEVYPSAFSEQVAAYHDALMKEVESGQLPLTIAATPQRSHGAATTTHLVSPMITGNGVAPQRPIFPSDLHQNAEEDQEEGEEARATTGGRSNSTTGGQEEEEDGGAPRQKTRTDEAVLLPSLATITERTRRVCGSTGVPYDREEEEDEEPAVLGSAALRMAAPLPAEAKEATPVLRRIAYIYSYHPKKDLFEAAYWRDLARRCLHPHRRVNAAAENAFIVDLRDICGLPFTSKFEGMLTDLETSTQLSTQFRTWLEERAQDGDKAKPAEKEKDAAEAGAALRGVETHLLILTQSFWPKYAPLAPNLFVPPMLRAVTGLVETFYAPLFANRHLSWYFPLSTVTITGRLTANGSLLTLTGTYVQAMVLLRLDVLQRHGVAAVTLKELCAGLGMDFENADVLWSLQGLCQPRFGLVLREGSTPASKSTSTTSTGTTTMTAGEESVTHGGLSVGDVLRLNLTFTSTTTKVRLPLSNRSRAMAVVTDAEGGSRGTRSVDTGAPHLVEVALVTCLKALRSVSHADLVAEVHRRVPFSVSVPVLKKSIEKLIERGFMVRGRDNTYRFSA